MQKKKCELVCFEAKTMALADGNCFWRWEEEERRIEKQSDATLSFQSCDFISNNNEKDLEAWCVSKVVSNHAVSFTIKC